MLDIYAQRRAIWHWNTKRNIEAVAQAINQPAAHVQAYLETLGERGYPGRIRLHAYPDSELRRLVPRHKESKRQAGRYAIFDITP